MDIDKKKILKIFDKYFLSGNKSLIFNLPVNKSNLPHLNNIILVKLPIWAKDLGIGNPPSILVPKHCAIENHNWQNVDWWRAVFEMITCKAEYEYEKKNRPIHSYAFRLPKSLNAQFKYAWANRIILFLMRWASYKKNTSEEKLFGLKPKGKIYLTHDVDYISKTFSLRFKRSVFIIINILRSLTKLRITLVIKDCFKLFNFFFISEKYWCFEKINALEKKFNMRSIWNFYGGNVSKKSFSELIFDPSYNIDNEDLSNQMRKLKMDGHFIGLHQAFNSWYDKTSMLIEKKNVEKSLGEKIKICRQHWLRFSLIHTWKAQEKAEFELDTTLGFNEMPGFRNSAALNMPAWIVSEKRFSNTLNILPMVLMDSHLFDYNQMKKSERKKKIDEILDEIKFVGGEATIIWHQHVFYNDFNWGDEYQYLLKGIKARRLQ
jgi:hypothetical protein